MIRPRIYRLHHNPDASRRIGYLATQQATAYNKGVDIVRKTPEIVLWKSKTRPDSFKSRVSEWRKSDRRVDCPTHLLETGAEQAWYDNDRINRQKALYRFAESDQEALTKEGYSETLSYRSRKHDPSDLMCLKPPVRRAADEFAVPGVDDLILRTREPVPDLDIRSFRLVEIHSERHGANRPLEARRYALQLNVVKNYPDSTDLTSVNSPEDVLGIDDGTGKRLALSTGDAIDIDDSRAVRRIERTRSDAARKEKGSKRQKKALKQAQRAEGRIRAERKRSASETAKSLFARIRPKVLAVSPESYRATTRLIKGVTALTDTRVGLKLAPVSSETIETMVAEAEKQGIHIYTLMPDSSDQECKNFRRRDDRESQAGSRCRSDRCEQDADLSAARNLQWRAFHYIGPAASRTLYAGEPPMGRRVKSSRATREPSCDALGANKPTSDRGQIGSGPDLSPPTDLMGVSLKAGSSVEQGAQRELLYQVRRQYIITNELVSIVNMLNERNIAYETKRNRAEGLAVWATWATINKHRILPAEPAYVASFLAALADLGYSTQTIYGHLKGIIEYHSLLGLCSPVTNEVQRVVQGIERTHGKWGKQAKGLSREHMQAIEATAFTPIRRETTRQTRERGLKVIALVKLMRDCLLRRSEAANVRWRNLSQNANGSGTLLVERSKTDQFGLGAVLYVSRETMQTLSHIRWGAGDDDSVFGWNPDQISYRIKQAMDFAGFGDAYSTHSMRRGMAQELAIEHATLEEINEAGRWVSNGISVRYTVPDDPMQSPVARYHKHLREREGKA